MNYRGFRGSNFQKFSNIFENFENFRKTVCVEFHWWFHQNSSKFYRLRPFWIVKHWFFEKISENVSNFWPIFREKFGPLEQPSHPPKFLLKNAVNMIFGGPIEQHIDQNFWGPPKNISGTYDDLRLLLICYCVYRLNVS